MPANYYHIHQYYLSELSSLPGKKNVRRGAMVKFRQMVPLQPNGKAHPGQDGEDDGGAHQHQDAEKDGTDNDG